MGKMKNFPKTINKKNFEDAWYNTKYFYKYVGTHLYE